MKEHKSLIIFSSVFGIIALICSLYFSKDPKFVIYYDMSISIFTALVVIVCTSLISYKIIKRKTLENFYSAINKLAAKYYSKMNYYNEKDLEEKIDGIFMLSEIDYERLDNSFGNMCFLFNKGKGRNIVIDLYHYIKFIRTMVNDSKEHIDLHTSIMGYQKKDKLEEFIKPVYDLFFQKREYEYKYDTNKIQIGEILDYKVIDELDEKMGILYNYMYSKNNKGDEDKQMKKWHYVTKCLFQIFLLAFEIGGFIALFIFVSSKFVVPHNIIDILERGLIGFSIYEIIIYIALNMITDIKKDSYLAIKSNYELLNLYFETKDKNLEEKILKNINYELDCGTINSFDLREEYNIMKNILESQDHNNAKYKLILFNHLYEAEDLKWKYSILLRLFK